jgi:N-methylhydantoinase A/acetophenone carboxylase
MGQNQRDAGYEINIDVGGTFTDFFLEDPAGGVQLTKTPTTHYDLSVGFMRGIRDLANSCGLGRDDLLGQTRAVRYCTTVGTNALIERTGPKLGMITTAGFEDTIFLGRARSWADGVAVTENRDLARINKPAPLISRDMVVGVRERVDSSGQVVCPLTEEEVLERLQVLVDRGAMGFVVCLLWSFVNPVHERLIKTLIEDEYPEDYLGSMPVTLSCQVSPKQGEYTRFVTTMVNAYIHGVMAEELNSLIHDLRSAGYTRPLQLVQNTGGMKKVSRTRAVLTHNAGPVAGLHGAATLGGQYGRENVIFTDMGGTSFDIGVITDGRLKTYDFIQVIDRWRTNVAAIEVKSIGAGGGSIAWLNPLMDNFLNVGPVSAGSMPGPACYDQGGQEPTVTDADLVLGYLDPDNYLGGEMLLATELAEEVIREKIADPLGLDLAEAASRIRALVDANMGQEAFNEVALKGHDPRDFVLFACGGAGPTHACGFASYLGVPRVLVPYNSPVFGAYGASTVKVQQVWDHSATLKLFRFKDQAYSEDLEGFNRVVEGLRDLAVRDLRLEGYSEDGIQFQLELDMRYGMQYNLTKVISPHLTVKSADQFKDICDRFTEDYSSVYSPEATYPQGGINVECFYLTARVEQESPRWEPAELSGPEPPAEAALPPRRAYWRTLGGFNQTPVYDFHLLRPGNVIVGPGLVDARHTTFVIEPDWRFSVDQFSNGVLEPVRPARPS